MSTFLALYRGDTVASAQLVAVTADPTTVADFAARLLRQPPAVPEAAVDPVLHSIEQGQRKALRLVEREARRPSMTLIEAQS